MHSNSRLYEIIFLLILAQTIFCIPTSKAEDNFAKAYQSFNLNQLKQDIKELSSDSYEGREPGTKGGQKTTNFLQNAFEELGFKAGNNGSFLQSVPLVSITTDIRENLTIGSIQFDYLKNYVANSRQMKTDIDLIESQLVFVGYGINAPEYGWNDYENVDVKGKTVVILINDPGYASQDPKLFDGNSMTYYGRWIYKYEEAARQGASAAIIIHETKPASYGWNVIESSWSGAQYHLPASEVKEPSVDIEMWISLDKAKALFKQAGFNFAKLKQKALNKDFKAIPLDLKANIKINNKIKKSHSNNVIATLPGNKYSDEHIIYMAHWDHLGSTIKNGTRHFYNGAHDNATGTAGLIAIAKAFKQLNKNTERSITMIAVTAEEQGRLGSRYFANHPTIPLNKVVGLINMDSLNITGLKKDIRVVGFGKSEMEQVLASAASRQDRTLTPEKTPERGYYYRSDHFSLAKKGVPGLSAGGGTVPLNSEQAIIASKVATIIGNCYHQICDEYNEAWGWQGMIADLQVFFETGYILGNSRDWPNWNKKTEFRAIRDNMMKP